MKKITIQFYDIEKYFSELGGILYIITSVFGIFSFAFVKVMFFQ
jgi:hypothetical protein